MTRLLVFHVLLLTCALSVSSWAQEPPGTVLTLDDAIARAQAESFRIAEATARQEGAAASVASRRAAQRPTVNVSGGYTRTNHVDEFGVPQPNGMLRVIYPDIPDNYFTRAVLQWPIYTGGRTDALIRAAEAETRAAAADVDAARADLRLEVTRAYWALSTATDSIRVVEAALARADAHLRDVRSRFDQGLIPPNEVSAVEAQRARQTMQLIEARNLRRSVAEDMRRLTGLQGEIAVNGLAASSAPAPGADEERPELRAIRERLVAAEGRVSAVEATRKPAVAFNAAADYANPNPRIFPRADVWQPSWEVGVVGTWTLWDGGRRAAESAEAAASVRVLRARQADLDSLFSTEMRQRALDLESARAILDAADVAVRSAADTRRVVTERFNVGVTTSTEVLDAEVALLQAEMDRTRALANIRLAEARLERARGR
jgi:outer membrane protein